VEFGDFQCPFCKSYFQQTYPDIKSKYIDTGKVKLIFRHFPLTQIHVNAQISAVAAECANQQGKFWQYHDLLYTNGQSDGTALDKASLEKYATQIGLNSGTLGFGKNKFNQCLEGSATLSIVNADQQEGIKDGVSGTPSFFINGKPIVGAQPATTFETAIEAALKQ
jgi:protein-disulfide isomerase